MSRHTGILEPVSHPHGQNVWPEPSTCAACIEAAGGSRSALQIVMSRRSGETAGVGMKDAKDFERWLDSLEYRKCPCMPVSASGRPAYFVNRSKRAKRKEHGRDNI